MASNSIARLTKGCAFEDATPPTTGPIFRVLSSIVGLDTDLVISASKALSVNGQR